MADIHQEIEPASCVKFTADTFQGHAWMSQNYHETPDACKKPLEVFDSVWMLTTGTYKREQAETPGSYFNPIRAWHAEHAEKLALESPLVGHACSICGEEFGSVERVTFQVSGSIPESGYIGLEAGR